MRKIFLLTILAVMATFTNAQTTSSESDEILWGENLTNDISSLRQLHHSDVKKLILAVFVPGDDLLKGGKITSARVAILEDVVNPTNVGAIVRSAAALNIDAIMLTSASADPLYRRAVRVSMGTIFQIPWTVIPDGEWQDKTITMLHDRGFKLVSMALKENTKSIADPVFKSEDKLAIVLGTEGEGLKNKTIEMSDYTVKIPMSHGVDSLNVAAASAVAFWALANI